MPRGCKPTGDHALSNAERQARYRARQQWQRPRRSRVRAARPIAAVAPSVGVTPSPYLRSRLSIAAWLTALPESLQGSATADALEAIVDLDLRSLLTSNRHAVTGVIKPTIDRPDRQKKK